MSFVSVAMNPAQANGTVRREIERLLQDAVPMQTGVPAGPAANGYEDATGFTMEFDVPGFSPDKLEVLAQDGTLTISGTHAPAETGKDTRVLFAERSTRSFERSLRLLKTADTSNISAHYVNGVLTVKVAKLPIASPRRVAINVGDSVSTPASAK